jgi:hypothetical protein
MMELVERMRIELTTFALRIHFHQETITTHNKNTTEKSVSYDFSMSADC